MIPSLVNSAQFKILNSNRLCIGTLKSITQSLLKSTKNAEPIELPAEWKIYSCFWSIRACPSFKYVQQTAMMWFFTFPTYLVQIHWIHTGDQVGASWSFKCQISSEREWALRICTSPVSILDTFSAVTLCAESEFTHVTVVTSPSQNTLVTISRRSKVRNTFVTVVSSKSC